MPRFSLAQDTPPALQCPPGEPRDPAERPGVSQNFAFIAYAPGAGTSNASVGMSATTGVALTANAKYAFTGSGKFFFRFGAAAVAAATTDLWLPADTIGVFDTAPGREYVSFLSASGTITVTFVKVS